KLQWTGYKTATKAGVNGTFENITYSGKTQGKDLGDLIEGASLTMGLMSPKSGDAGRDANLTKGFFKLIGETATAKVTKMERGFVRTDVKLGKKTVEVALKPELKDNVLEMNGTLDLFDFGLGKALTSINKLCRALHEGKTWNDVAVKVTASVTPCKAK